MSAWLFSLEDCQCFRLLPQDTKSRAAHLQLCGVIKACSDWLTLTLANVLEKELRVSHLHPQAAGRERHLPFETSDHTRSNTLPPTRPHQRPPSSPQIQEHQSPYLVSEEPARVEMPPE